MTVLFGTLGWRPQSLLPSIRSTSHLDRVAFYHSDHAKSRDARAKVAEFCRGLGVPCTAVEVSDAYDLLQVAGQIRADVRKEKSAGMDLRFNIAGGTRLMSSAALLVCILEGIPATYVHDETYRARAPPPPDDVRRRTDPKAAGRARVSRQEPREVVLGNGPGPRLGGPQGHDEPPSAQARVDGHDRAPGRSGRWPPARDRPAPLL